MTKQPEDTGTEQPREEAKQPKIIKRYSNRKLYDTGRSKYVTLDEIATMIKAGDHVTIIDNETKEDLTAVTLTQIVYEEEKRESRMPLAMLRNLIQTGGEALQDFFDKSVKTPALEAQEVVRQSAIGLRDAASRGVTELTGSARRLLAERKAEEFKKGVTAQFDELENRLRSRIDDVSTIQQEEPAEGGPADDTDVLAAHKIESHVQMLKERLLQVERLVEELRTVGESDS